MHRWIGTSGFQYSEWKGGFYPGRLSLAKMLGFYSERFASTEINYSFRQIPSESSIRKWAEGTPEHFRFSFKAPQKVTHFSKLRNCEETVNFLHEMVGGLGEKCGPVLFQLPPTFKKDGPLLHDFLESLPMDMQAAFEFRHESWFDDGVYQDLAKHGASLCHAESADLVTPREVTADFGYLRLRREDYSQVDLEDWADFIKSLEGQWNESFIYFKHEAKGVGPVFGEKMQQLLAAPH